MAYLSVFQFQTEKSVRVETINDEAWFCLADVAAIMEIQNARQLKLNAKGVCKKYTPTAGGKQELVFINEPNLYRVIFRSNKPEAVKFQDWIFEEVIPQIRKTGSYQNPQHSNDYLNDWECEQIRQAVKARSLRTGETTQAIYTKLHAYMGCDSYMNICQVDFQTALNFLASIENVPTLFNEQKHPLLFSEHEISRFAVILFYFEHAAKQLKDLSEPLKELGATEKGIRIWTIWSESRSWVRYCRETLERVQPSMRDLHFKEQVRKCLLDSI